VNEILIAVIALLQVADGATSFYAIEKQGLPEANPLMNLLFDRVGLVPGLVCVKVAFITFLLMVPVYAWLYWSLIALYTGVVANNTRVIYKHKKQGNN
jgi:hypothetical protein